MADKWPAWLPANMIDHWNKWRSDSRNKWTKGTPEEQIEFWRHAARLGVDVDLYTDVLRHADAKEARPFSAGIPAFMENATQIPAAFWRGVMDVETNGQTLTPDGHPVCRFEVKQWRRLSSAEAWEKASLFLRGSATWQGGDDMVWLDDSGWHPIHGSQLMERNTIAFVATFGERDIAYQTTSWGVFQLMGWHYQLAGYDTAEAMAVAFASPLSQADAYLAWLRARGGLEALASGNLCAFVKIHNGDADVGRVAAKIDHAARQHGWEGFAA